MTWWQRGVIYQIYPRSFQDTNGDGVGDLPGITRRLPYLVELGVHAIWLSPIFRSPMRDFGYDIADYCTIDPVFGTMEDFDELLQTAHDLGLKVLLDFVPNHTSDQHPWFIESRQSRNSAKRDWYLWRDPAGDGGPPNNWLSEFGGSAWAFDRGSGQYYYHAFLPEQPDLNWRNPAVRDAMQEVMRFWLRKGVDGFRIDVLWHLIKDDQFRDNPPNPNYRDGDPPPHRVLPLYTTDRPEVHEVVAGLRAVAEEFADRMLIGEIYLPPERLVAYYGKDLEGVHLPFNFGLIETSWHARTIAKLIDDYEAALPPGSWPNWVLSNHDKVRIASRVGPAQARVAAMLLLTLRGTPTVYYGDELGLEDVAIAARTAQDPLAQRIPSLGRDGARAPMRWDATPWAGFSRVRPWCVVSETDVEPNAISQRADEGSMLTLYRRLLKLRNSLPALMTGAYVPMVATGDVLLFRRELAPHKPLIVALNFGDRPAAAIVTHKEMVGHIVLSTFCGRDGEVIDGEIDLRPNEGLIIELS
jgi:alpha-glucosidase